MITDNIVKVVNTILLRFLKEDNAWVYYVIPNYSNRNLLFVEENIHIFPKFNCEEAFVSVVEKNTNTMFDFFLSEEGFENSIELKNNNNKYPYKGISEDIFSLLPSELVIVKRNLETNELIYPDKIYVTKLKVSK